MKKDIKLYEATITNDDVKKIIRELKNNIKEHKKEKCSISAGMGMTWKEWDIFFEYFDYLEEENKESEEAVYYWQKENDKKQQKIDEAVEYINYCDDLSVVNDYYDTEKPIIEKIAKKELLDILNDRNDE